MDYLEAAHEQRDGKWGTWIGLSELEELPGIQRIKKMGFKLISNDRQLKNGSLVFQSEVGAKAETQDAYTITANGYIRREFAGKIMGKPSGERDRYPLNKAMEGYAKPIDSVEKLEKAIDWLADFLERNPHRHNPEEAKNENARQKKLDDTRWTKMRERFAHR